MENKNSCHILMSCGAFACIRSRKRNTFYRDHSKVNLLNVIAEIKKCYPACSLIIAGDDDRWKEKNIGRDKAE